MAVSESENFTGITVELSALASIIVTVTSGEIFSKVVHVKVVKMKYILGHLGRSRDSSVCVCVLPGMILGQSQSILG